MGTTLIVLAVFSVLLSAFTFAVYYGVTSPFWKSWQGRAVFSLAAIFVFWFAFGLLFRTVHPAAWLNLILSLAIAAGIDAVFITLTISLVCARAKDRRRKGRGRG